MKDNNRNQYNQNWNADNDRFDQDNSYNSQSGQHRNFDNTSQGSPYGRQNDWNNNRDNTSNYRNDFGGNQSFGNWQNNQNDFDSQRRQANSNYGNTSYNDWDNRRNYDNRNNQNGPRDWWNRTKEEVSSWFNGDDNDRRRDNDNRFTGVHRGKGPKGYTRSDDRIREDVHDRLSDDSHVDASDIEVKVENSEVILSGNVSNREEKRRAEDLVEAVSGVRHVENRLRINQERFSEASQRRGNSGTTSDSYSGTSGNYTGTTNDIGGIGSESGTTNEIIRNSGNQTTNR